jgi:hypothetical protein
MTMRAPLAIRAFLGRGTTAADPRQALARAGILVVVPEAPRPPVAIRITRPQTTEDDFLEQELETLNRTSVTLLGAQPRPQGVVLRFEIVLSTGYVVMRGEGRVVGFRPNAHQGLGGLTLRFTRLDSRTKTLVDKAAALRERRRPSSAAPAPPEPSPPPSGSVEDPSPPREPSSPSITLDEPLSSGLVADVPAPSETAAHASREPPPQREALLDRLRTRAKTLDPVAVQRILEARRHSS